MQIKPVQPVMLTLTHNENKGLANLIHMSPKALDMSSSLLFCIGNVVEFRSNFFCGFGTIQNIKHQHYQYQYHLSIEKIHYRRGIVIDQIL